MTNQFGRATYVEDEDNRDDATTEPLTSSPRRSVTPHSYSRFRQRIDDAADGGAEGGVFGFELDCKAVEPLVDRAFVVAGRGGASGSEQARNVAQQADEQLAGLRVHAGGSRELGMQGGELVAQVGVH